MKPSMLLFNTVERLMRGDFFHAVTPTHIREELWAFPPRWRVAGLGTTNWYARNGEVLIDGCASDPRFLWADPDDSTFVDLDRATVEGVTSPSFLDPDDEPALPFAAVALWDPSGPSLRTTIETCDDVHAAVDELCRESNIGLAAIGVEGPVQAVEYQGMCRIPLGGVADDRPPVARVEHAHGAHLNAVGFYSANPTIRAMIAHESASVHLHGRLGSSGRGGHVNRVVATSDLNVEIVPLQDLVLRIHDLEVAAQPIRKLA